ncbi:PREDICTED: cysteine and glycine-rich protein 1-like [Priapulus caudatus]|uniref:Cysteine and glycine-rich protein 1-like n=1 Tax=Priapulus caudatus TaxID=37621 RepID=A0ABM1ECL5_PRICU|nr:PREDICTED: cysteine and glycine-rich protein 1-like [Priapulus caudatus]XP_014669936.1 PREDICTED: cysteine and glycine-rich protein 1-like [Priapulus caudatus]
MPKCPKCDKEVYFAEQKLALGKTWHKACFRCENCSRGLDANHTEHADNVYCRNCYGKLFGPKGIGFGMGAGALSMDTGDAYKHGVTRENVPGTAQAHVAGKSTESTVKPRWGVTEHCPRCSGSVYMAEKVMAAGQSWHRGCFTCTTCKKKLDSTSLTERDSDIYCTTCYGRQFGPRGVGYGMGAGVLNTGQ